MSSSSQSNNSSNEVYTNTYISIGVERTSFPLNLHHEKQSRGTGSNKTRDETKPNLSKKRNAKVTPKSKKFIPNDKNRLSCYNIGRHDEKNPLFMSQRPLQRGNINYPELKNSGLVVKKENFGDSENFDVKSEEFESVHQLNQQYNNIEELESDSESSLRTNWEKQIQKGYESY